MSSFLTKRESLKETGATPNLNSDLLLHSVWILRSTCYFKNMMLNCGAHVLMIQTVHHAFHPLSSHILEFYIIWVHLTVRYSTITWLYWCKIQGNVMKLKDIHDKRFGSSTCGSHSGAPHLCSNKMRPTRANRDKGSELFWLELI